MNNGFGSRFAPDETFMRWAWDRVIATTDLSPGEIEPAYLPWRDACVAGDPRREARALRDSLGGRTFRWFWFERCFEWIEREIAPVHGWPYLWRTAVRGTLRSNLPFGLLAGELGGMTYRARSRAQAARFQQRRLPLRQESEVVLVAGWGCKVEDEIARSFKERFSAGDGTAWPPYFPGDRTAVRLEIIGGRNATASEIARCRLSAIAPLWPVPPTMPLPDLPAAL